MSNMANLATNIELALENNGSILFAYAATMMERKGLTAADMTPELCNSLAARFLADLDWVAEGVREIRAGL
jgi:hypothetical protein